MRLWILLLLLAVSGGAFAQSAKSRPATMTDTVNNMQEVLVTTGVSKPTRLQDALSLYRVIGKDQFQAQGAVNLADALATQLNIKVAEDGVLGSNLRMQGLSGDKVKILIDGLPVNGREGGNVDLGQINLNNIERIEIVQGPMSVVYGSDALGGVINLITKKTRKPWEVQAGAFYESVGKYNYDAQASYRLNPRHLFRIGGGRNYFDGWGYDDTSTLARTLRHRMMSFKPKEQYLANINYNYTAASGFTLGFSSDLTKEKLTNKGELSGPIASSWQYNAHDEFYRTTRINNRLIADMSIGRTGHLSLQNGYAFYHRRRNSYNLGLSDMEYKLDTVKGMQDTSIYQDINLRSAYSNKLGTWSVTAGYDILLQYGQSTDKMKDGSQNQHDFAAYANISKAFFKEKLTAQLGLRGGYNTRYQSPVIPSLNLMYKGSDAIQLRASYAKGFRAPSLKERYLNFFDTNHEIIGNPDLNAEYSDHIQASFSYRLQKAQSNYLQLTATGFYNDVNNMIALTQVDPKNLKFYTYSNVLKQRNAIANLQAEWKYRALLLQAGYGYAHVFEQPGEHAAFGSSEVTTTARYYFKKPRIAVNAFYKVTGKQPSLISNIDGSSSYGNKMPAYQFVDLSVERSFWNNKIQLIAGVKNIFDTRTVTALGGTPVVVGAHSGGNGGSLMFLPRRFFTSLRLNLN